MNGIDSDGFQAVAHLKCVVDSEVYRRHPEVLLYIPILELLVNSGTLNNQFVPIVLIHSGHEMWRR